MYARSEQLDARVTRASGFTRPSRWAGRALFCALIAFLAALVPVGFDHHYTSDNELPPVCYDGVMVGFSTSTAYAATGEQQNAMEYLDFIAEIAGMPANAFVATVSGLCGVGSGYIVAGDNAITFDNSLADNLGYLADAADYPAWDSLTADEQTAWGTQTRYDAAKFNALCDAFGIGDLRQEYYSSGGGDLDVNENQRGILEHIGGIGQRWSDNMSASFASMKSLFPDGFAGDVGNFFSVQGDIFNGSGLEGWDGPSYSVYVNYGSEVHVYGGGGSSTLYFLGRPQVYWILAREGSYVYYACFSLSNFADQWNPTVKNTINGVDYYYRRGNLRNSKIDGVNVDGVPAALNGAEWNVSAPYVYYYILTKGMGSAPATMPGYPEGGADTINDYTYYVYPEEGVKQGDTYNNFVTDNPTRPENPYNPNNQTSTPEWKDDTAASVVPLAHVNFEKLFPFCLLWDVKLVFDKMKNLGVLPDSGSGSDLSSQGEVTDNWQVYTTIKVPISQFNPGGEFIAEGEEIEFDLVPLRTMLLIIRPALQVLLIVGLIYSLIKFWKGVIFG